MCGLFGVIYSNKAIVPEAERLNRTLDLLWQRGPDAF